MQLNRRESLAALTASGLLASCGVAPSNRERDVAKLASVVHGPVSLRGGADYETARKAVWCANAPDRYPAAIIQASSSQDVQTAVRFAKDNGFRIAIRGGGHNWSAASLRDGAIMIDLGALTEFRIDPEARRAVVQPGVSGGALFDAAMAQNLMFPIAHCPSVPMSGFLLNGGYGFNAGELGPSAMLIESMEIVTASGDIVRASQSENSDLFWAARGAGPSFFGIVTQFELRLLPLQQAIVATNLIYPLAATDEVTQMLHEKREACPRNVELTFLASAGAGPPDAPAIGIVGAVAFANDDAAAKRSLNFLDEFPTAAKPIAAQRKVQMGWPDLFEAVASLFPPRMSYLGNTIWTASPVSELYTPYAKHLAKAPSPHSFSNCVLYPAGFREDLRGYDAALSMQGDILSLQYAIWRDPADSARNEAWFQQSTALFQPHAAGHYIGETDLNLYPQFAQNCFSDESWRRLAVLRKQYDPSGLFFDFLGQAGDVR